MENMVYYGKEDEMKKLVFLFLLMGILSSCAKKQGNIMENTIENTQVYNDSVNKIVGDSDLRSKLSHLDLENIKYEIVDPGNRLSLEDWKNNNNESERIRILFERFCGYYINVVDFGTVKIAKLSLDEHLILQTVSLTEDGFVEGVRFILDEIDWDNISFHQSNDASNEYFDFYNYYRIYLSYYPKYEIVGNRTTHNDHIIINIGRDEWDSSNNFYTNNFDELGAIVGSILQTQEKYTGKFIFQEYEYYESYNRNDDSSFKWQLEQIKEETEQKIIEVNRDEKGYLFVSGIRNESSLTDNTIRNILITDNGRKIYGQSGDGSFKSMSLLFYFLNEDTIISEYSSFTGSEEGRYTSLDYKAKYIKTEEIYE
jgi:hypothetical protein